MLPIKPACARDLRKSGLTVTVYHDIHAGEFGELCGLLLPEALKRITDNGFDCQTFESARFRLQLSGRPPQGQG